MPAKTKDASQQPQSRMFTPRNIPGTQPTLTDDQLEAVAIQDAQRKIDRREQERADKISRLIGGKDVYFNVVATNIIPMRVVESICIKDHSFIEGLPKWVFSRYYPTEGIVIDHFFTQRDYDEAQVDLRKTWVEKTLGSICGFDLRYAALGPDNKTLDLVDKLGL